VRERTEQLEAFYAAHRIDDQLRFYRSRRRLFDRAAGQAMALTAVLLGIATAAAALGGTEVGPPWLWPVLATVLPAAASAVTAVSTLYAFEQQSKIYVDAIRAVRAAGRPGAGNLGTARPAEEDAAGWVERSEAAFRQEHAQWGQLTSQIAAEDTRT
jgi:hypothetical protein